MGSQRLGHKWVMFTFFQLNRLCLGFNVVTVCLCVFVCFAFFPAFCSLNSHTRDLMFYIHFETSWTITTLKISSAFLLSLLILGFQLCVFNFLKLFDSSWMLFPLFFALYLILWNFYCIVFNSFVFLLNCVESSDESIEGILHLQCFFFFCSISFWFL